MKYLNHLFDGQVRDICTKKFIKGDGEDNDFEGPVGDNMLILTKTPLVGTITLKVYVVLNIPLIQDVVTLCI